jgi:hypothetical protein
MPDDGQSPKSDAELINSVFSSEGTLPCFPAIMPQNIHWFSFSLSGK